MIFLDAVRIAWQGTSRRRLRTALTAASLTIGVLTLVVVQGAQSLVHDATLHSAILRNGPATTLRLQLTPDGGEHQQWWLARLRNLTAATPTAVCGFDGFSAVNIATGEGRTESVDLFGTDAGLRQIRPLRVLHGTWFTGDRLAPQVLLNQSAAAQLAPLRAPVRLLAPEGGGWVTVTVTGVVDDGASAPAAYIERAGEPLLAAAGLRPVVRSVLLSGPDLTRDRIAGPASALANLTGHQGDIGDLSRVDTVQEYDGQLATQRRIFLGIAVLCLIVGSLGILNIGLSVLRERTEELSLRRALGASRPAVALIMLLESQLVALTAAGLAVGLAYLVAPWFMDQLVTVDIGSANPPLSTVLLGVVASCLAAMAGAVAPSLRAARVPIATLLR